MSKLLTTEHISFLDEHYDEDSIVVDCLCPERKVYVIRHLLSQQECENIICWMNSEAQHEELGRDAK